MKIQRLYLKNFLPIHSALNKSEIDLDFRESDKLINVIIGKIGSCKTVILGHLQPFHSFGTLDIRNQDSSIVEGKEGIKILELVDGENEYVIKHLYHPVKDTHSVKSYISKNGEELNPNGNVTSFRDWIFIEFGLDQNYLRLIRLGANVTNLIDMKSAERKSFVAAMLSDVEAYQLMYKWISSDLRDVTAQINMLVNKLNQLNGNDEDEIEKSHHKISHKLKEAENAKDEAFTDKAECEALISSLLDGRTFEQVQTEYDNSEEYIKSVLSEVNDLGTKIDTCVSNYKDISQLSLKIGNLNGELTSNTNQIIQLSEKYKELSNELSKLIDVQYTIGDKAQIQRLNDSYNDMLKLIGEYESVTKDFKCKYSSTFIRNLDMELDTFNQVIVELTNYPQDLLKLIYNSDSSILKYAERKEGMLTGRLINIQKSLSSLKFIEKYVPTRTLYLPPCCPTDDCPYRITHPTVIQNQMSGTDWFTDEYKKNVNLMESINIDIATYREYPIIFKRINQAKEMWSRLRPVLEDINALHAKTLLSILTNRVSRDYWYNHSKIVETIEKCEKRDKYYELLEMVNKMKSELHLINVSDFEKLESDISNKESDIDDAYTSIAALEARNKEIKNELDSLDEVYQEMTHLDNLKLTKTDKENEVKLLKPKLQELSDVLCRVDALNGKRDILIRKFFEKETAYKTIKDEFDSIRALLNDIRYTKREFNELQEKQETMKIIQKALSSKEGIQLVFVNVFLNSCKDIINDLISDVFGDTLEIQEFKINDNEFSIPYTLNGVTVSDIEKASQGQKSIISIALSFALMRKSNTKWTIPLLDEVDGPLYKSDRQKFLTILFKHLHAIHSEQCFLISHNNTFEGYSVNFITTTDEVIDQSDIVTIMKV